MEQACIRKNRFLLVAVVIAVLNPIFSGLILGLLMYSEPEFKREGRLVTLFAVAWGIITLLLLAKFRHLLVL